MTASTRPKRPKPEQPAERPNAGRPQAGSAQAGRPNPDASPPPADREKTSDALSLGPLPGYLGYKLRQAQAASFRHIERMAGDTDLSPGRFSLLTVIGANPGITQTRIARAFGLDKSTLSPVVDQLVKRRLVARKRSRTDGRAFGLSLTAAGGRLLDAKRAQIEDQEKLLAAALSPAQHAQMMALLDRIVAVLDEAP